MNKTSDNSNWSRAIHMWTKMWLIMNACAHTHIVTSTQHTHRSRRVWLQDLLCVRSNSTSHQKPGNGSRSGQSVWNLIISFFFFFLANAMSHDSASEKEQATANRCKVQTYGVRFPALVKPQAHESRIEIANILLSLLSFARINIVRDAIPCASFIQLSIA